MTTPIVDIRNFENHAIGAKAAMLFSLRKRGFNVPNLTCLSADFFREKTAVVQGEIQTILDSSDYDNEAALDAASLRIFALIRQCDIAMAIREVLSDFLTVYTDAPIYFSVRSSSDAEDRENDSFAGQFDTFLNISASEIPDKVLACYLSLYAPGALRYCHSRNLPVCALCMSVIIQKMVPAELSGVAFSANPKGLLNEMVIVVGRGTGDGVVADRVSTTAYYVNEKEGVYYYECQDHSPLLSEKTLLELMRIVSELQKDFDGLADIEYAVSEDKVFILQARPITSMRRDNPIVLDNSNIVESYPNISLPLTVSFVRQAYTGVFRNLAEIVMPWENAVAPFDDVLQHMVESANGRIYYNINNWYVLLQCMPMRRKIIPIWQEMLGVADKSYPVVRRISPLHSIRSYASILLHFRRVPKSMHLLNMSFHDVTAYYNDAIRRADSVRDFMTIYHTLSDKILKNWGVTLLNDMYAFVYVGALKTYLRHLKVESPEQITNGFLSGMMNIESMKPVLALRELAGIASRSGLCAKLSAIEDGAALDALLSEEKGPFADAFRAYIEQFGDRCPEELKMESRTFRADPIRLVRTVLEHVSGSPVTPGSGHSRSNAYRATESDSSSPQFPPKTGAAASTLDNIVRSHNVIRRKIIRHLADRAKRGIENRETSRLNRSRIYGMVRNLFLRSGELLATQGAIDSPRDIFYMTVEEVDEVSTAPSDPPSAERPRDLRRIIAGRKADYTVFEKLPGYNRLIFAGPVFDKIHKNINAELVALENDRLTGIPCSNGIVTGEVIVVDDPKTVTDYKDKILVTHMTDPGWVFLLSLARGVIAEKGSLLSHTAIISRELGIPSVVGVKNITRILKTGDIVTLNGNTGEITVEPSEDPSHARV